ncbi:hypothetical protein J2S13_000731 [Oikeobacillus pervagus]|uniref:Competence protein ComK n=1 Tax=Oikeobacillus pervagus TaxID=1325931 RepID=A0AAJ1WI66_9BACI|nr:competence protein ComK [Oikeobacillus pervagus]MDQ0214335.1 hypothetical protein [Oikeobacillus pervagus]
MFNERIALKIRLEQLDDSESRILREFRQERDAIFRRLRELDSLERIGIQTEQSDLQQLDKGEPTVTKKRRGRRSAALNELRSTTVEILRQQNEPIRGVDLQKKIEETTGRKIANMTTFMVALERENNHVRKLGRGLYIYEYES